MIEYVVRFTYNGGDICYLNPAWLTSDGIMSAQRFPRYIAEILARGLTDDVCKAEHMEFSRAKHEHDQVSE